MPEIVFATTNQAKLDDVRNLMGTNLNVLGLSDVHIEVPEIDETGQTFEENALIKYQTLRPLVPDKYMLVAEDSGIEIDALGGEPGVYSRRWSRDGRELSDEEIIEKTLRLLAGQKDRTARFVSVIAFGGMGLVNQTLRGELIGQILEEPDERGKIQGFPYRALFFVPQLGRMLYEVHDISLSERPDHPTHREQVFHKLAMLINKL